MTDQIPSLDCIEKCQCFPFWLYDEKTGQRKDGITDAALAAFQTHYSKKTITKNHIFHYIYAILHSQDYRKTWADNLTKELPRIPFAARFDEFRIFSDAGKTLGDLHCGFDSVQQYQGVDIQIHKKCCVTLDDLQPADFRVEKMQFGNNGGTNKDLTAVRYNLNITVRNIPLRAHDYIVNGKSAIAWVIDRQRVQIDKKSKSGIVSDANRYASETLNNPRYPLELLLRVITVSLETLNIVRNLPKLDI